MPELNEWLSLPVFGGIAGCIYAIGRVYVLYRGGARSKERDAVSDRLKWHEQLVKRAEDAEDRKRYVQEVADYWRGVAGDYEYVIRTHIGEERLPKRPPYPARPTVTIESGE